jgi:hypothetical protein
MVEVEIHWLFFENPLLIPYYGEYEREEEPMLFRRIDVG